SIVPPVVTTVRWSMALPRRSVVGRMVGAGASAVKGSIHVAAEHPCLDAAGLDQAVDAEPCVAPRGGERTGVLLHAQRPCGVSRQQCQRERAAECQREATRTRAELVARLRMPD